MTIKLNNYFGKMIDICYSCEGDVIKFAGDALIIAFYKADYLASCLSFSLRIVEELNNFENLRLHVGIGVGETQFIHVGGELDRWEIMAVGDSIRSMGRAGRWPAREVCISSSSAIRIQVLNLN